MTSKLQRSRPRPSRLIGWLLIVALIVTWEISSLIHYVPSISSPDRIAIVWWQRMADGTLLTALLQTLGTMAIGFGIAVPLGIAIGFLMGRVRFMWALLEPLVEVIRLTPVTAIIPVFILFLGIGDQMKITVFVLASIFPLIITSYSGARSVSQTLSETARTYRLSWVQTQLEIALPASLPYILVGMRQALGTSLIMAVVVGMLAGNNGIGYYILMAQQALNVPVLLAAVFTVAAVGYLFNLIFLLIERRTMRWRRTDTEN